MSDAITLEFVKAYRRSFDDTGSGKSKLALICDELIRRMENDAAQEALRKADSEPEPPTGKSDIHPWTDDELKIHMENATWLTRTVCRSLLGLRAAARFYRSFFASALKEKDGHHDGCMRAENYRDTPRDAPCTCGYGDAQRELDAALEA